MGAREKLNAIKIGGSVVFATIAGGLSHSWLVFWLLLIGLIIADLHTGAIRPNPTSRRFGRGR